jgi:ATP-dependent Clp protease adapter protein ClpS
MTIDELFNAAAYMVVDMQVVSSELIQSKYSADRMQIYDIMEHLERAGIIVPVNTDRDKKVCIKSITVLEKILSVYKPSLVLESNRVFYKLILWNDDENNFDDVVSALENVLNSNTEKAHRITQEAETNGNSVVITGMLAKLVTMRDSIQERNIIVSLVAIV